VKKSTLPLVVLVLGLWVTLAIPQTTHHYPTPPEALDPQAPQKDSPALSRRLDLAQLQQEADDLARTAQTIPADFASVRKGMMPKDVIQKLKQIEKMSKHLRGALAQ
jgi:hypothetical protein